MPVAKVEFDKTEGFAQGWISLNIQQPTNGRPSSFCNPCVRPHRTSIRSAVLFCALALIGPLSSD